MLVWRFLAIILMNVCLYYDYSSIALPHTYSIPLLGVDHQSGALTNRSTSYSEWNVKMLEEKYVDFASSVCIGRPFQLP